jgi:hypothetical protein
MTRERIADGLELLVLQLANGETTLPEGWESHEWAYVKGLASGALWPVIPRLRAPEKG